MTRLLRIDASARRSRSLTRELGDLFEAEWHRLRPADTWMHRDLADQPPPHVTEEWIAAAFTGADARTPAQREALAVSDALVDELVAADLLVVTVPMYNCGMPSALKAWVDNVVRIGRTFSFDLARGDFPIEPVLRDKEMVALTSAGEFGFDPGGPRDHLDHLIPHLRAVNGYLGVRDLHAVRIEYQEFRDARHDASVRAAREETAALAARLAGSRATVGSATDAA